MELHVLRKHSFFFCVGCLQSVYGIHTFRVESIARGKASPVDDLQVQGISNPGLLRKVSLYSSVYISLRKNNSILLSSSLFFLSYYWFSLYFCQKRCSFLAFQPDHCKRSFKSYSRFWQKLE